MSTWTNEKHQWAQVLAASMTSPGEDTKVLLADALAEIKRLRALTTITDEKVEVACQVYTDDPYRPAKGTLRTTWETLVQVSPKAADDRRSAMRAALEAAHTPKENDA